jgi:tetratricopeptide (TPR) repeat protein
MELTQNPNPSSSPKAAIIAVLAVLIIGGLVYYFISQKKPVVSDSAAEITNTTKFNDENILVTPLPEVDASSNATIAFAGLKPISPEDSKKLGNYIASSTTVLPPLAESQKLLATYADYLKVFDQNASKTFYCKDNSCSLNAIRYAVYLATLRSLVYFEQGKYAEAKKSAASVIDVGKSLTGNNDGLITLLIGWVAQKYGYIALDTISKKDPSAQLSAAEKQELIATLRSEHKHALKFEYMQGTEMIDYINTPSKIPKYSHVDADTESAVAAYRKAIAENPMAWNYLETKKYFYDTTKNMIAHVDLPCGAKIPESMVKTGYNEQNTKDENYIGKAMYAIGGASIDTMNVKRCEIESAIQAL